MIAEQRQSPADEPIRVLVVDDEPQIASFLRIGLTYEGFSVVVAEDGEAALREAARFHPQLVILDLMLPGLDGLQVAEQLRQDPDVMIIMLTARDQVSDRVAGLRAGGDDYLVKPFDFEELLARVQAVLRRHAPPRTEVLRAGPVMLDHERHVVTVSGEVVHLTLKEYELLRLFLQNPQRVLTRQLILDRVWGYDFYGDENNVEVYIGYVRRKLGEHGREMIETVRGVGYRLNA